MGPCTAVVKVEAFFEPADERDYDVVAGFAHHDLIKRVAGVLLVCVIQHYIAQET